MDGFNEQVVKRKTKAKNIIIKIISVLLLFLVPIVCCILALAIQLTYLIYIGFFLFIAGIYLVWYVFTIQKVEFEYLMISDELQVSKIIALRKRKKVCNVSVRDFEKLGKGEKTIDNIRFAKTFIASEDIDNVDENYYAVFNNTAYGKCLLIFNPNENILKGMKPYLNKDIVLDLFYNRTR